MFCVSEGHVIKGKLCSAKDEAKNWENENKQVIKKWNKVQASIFIYLFIFIFSIFNIKNKPKISPIHTGIYFPQFLYKKNGKYSPEKKNHCNRPLDIVFCIIQAIFLCTWSFTWTGYGTLPAWCWFCKNLITKITGLQ